MTSVYIRGPGGGSMINILRGVKAIMFASAFSITTYTHEVECYVKYTSYTNSNLFQIQNFDYNTRQK